MIKMPRLDYIPIPVSKKYTNISEEEEKDKSKKAQRLEVASEKERNEMDFSKICEADDLPPDLEPAY